MTITIMSFPHSPQSLIPFWDVPLSDPLLDPPPLDPDREHSLFSLTISVSLSLHYASVATGSHKVPTVCLGRLYLFRSHRAVFPLIGAISAPSSYRDL